ncbi:glycosyltransferase [Paraflavitalea pollutisoli]|uniref:glycosyltransferase n=1 Tax=Paraflavitalea pollutisoli TaxID=3034143 RepID=UPI0023ED22E6|nr:glycosyltransferase [Paraflavitalea sp. H1-2-19X]
MISILIPVYNQDVNHLIARLSAGLSHLQGGGEIIVMDDGSNQATLMTNAPIAALPGVRCVAQFSNQGRARIRHLLAREAKGEWLLFLDGDSGIPHDDFLRRYEQALTAKATVIVGGRIYQQHPPDDQALRLHWRYGSARESRDPGKQHQPAFMTNNFLVARSVFDTWRDAAITEGYGHEDTLIGIQLEQQHIPIVYIDNPVVHEGLETADVFIRKSEQALVNLKAISREVAPDLLARHIKLFRVYLWLKKWRLLWAPVLYYQLFGKMIQRNLRSGNPSLKRFDLYRLRYFIGL